MRLSLRLAKLVHYTPDKNKRPGIIKAIVDATGLDRHLVSNLLRNVARGIPLDAMSRLCEFLVDHGYCSPDQLPGALFGVEAEARALAANIHRLTPLYTCKRLFVQRRAVKKYADTSAIDGAAAGADIARRMGVFAQGAKGADMSI